MQWQYVYRLTEIYTAPLNIVWFILGGAIAYQQFGTINLTNILLCLIDVFIFDLAVNVSDNYFDFKHAADQNYMEQTNPIGKYRLDPKAVGKLAVALYIISAIFGFFLVLRTGWPILLLGIVGYAIGIFYTAGSHPINATPVSETVVALSIAYLIQLVCVYVSIYHANQMTWKVAEVTFMLCLPLTLTFFVLQLANDTSDLDEDIKNNRFTLAYYLGKSGSVRLMKLLMISGIIFPLITVFLRLAPWPVALSTLLLPILWKGMQPFFRVQDKQKTFLLTVKNMSLFFIVYTLCFVIGTWLI